MRKLILINMLPEKEWNEFADELQLKFDEYKKYRESFFNWKSWVKNSKRDRQIEKLNSALESMRSTEMVIEKIEVDFQTAKMVLLMRINRIIAEIEEETSAKKSNFLSLLKESKSKYSTAVEKVNSSSKTHRVVQQLINPEDFKNSKKYTTENSIFYFCFEQGILNKLEEFKDVGDITKEIQEVIDEKKTRDKWIVFLHGKIKKLSAEENKNNKLINYLKYTLSQYQRELSYRIKTANDKNHPEYEISRISVERRFNGFCEQLKTSGLGALRKQHEEGWVLPPRGQKKRYMYEDGIYILEKGTEKGKHFFVISPSLKQNAVENLLDGKPWRLENFKKLPLNARQKFIEEADKNGEIVWKNPQEYARRGDIIYAMDKNGKKIPIAVYVDNKGGGVEPGETVIYVDANLKKAIAKLCNKENTEEAFNEFEKLLPEKREELTTTLYEGYLNENSDDLAVDKLHLWKQNYKDPESGLLDILREPKVTIDYNAAKKSGAVKSLSNKNETLGEAWARGYRAIRKNTRDNENSNAVAECLAGDITKAWGVRVQNQQLIESSYEDKHIKLMTSSEWNKKIACFSDKKSKFKMTGGSPSNGNYVVEAGKQKTTDKIKNFFEYFPLFVLQGDYDGFKDSNKAYIENGDGTVDLFCIDLGHVFRERSPLLPTFTDSLRVKPSSEFKNFSIFNDSLLSERMKGIHYLRKLRFGVEPNKDVLENYEDDFKNKLENLVQGSDLKIFNDYADYFSGKAVLAEDPKQKASYWKIVEGVREAKRNYLKDCDAMLAVFSSKKLDNIEAPYTSRLDLTVEELTLLDNLEKFSSETSTYAPDGKIELQHLDVKYESRVVWQLIKPAKKGDKYEFIGIVPYGKDKEKMAKELANYLIPGISEEDFKKRVKIGDKTISFFLIKNATKKIMQDMTEEKIRAHKEVKKLSEDDWACVDLINKMYKGKIDKDPSSYISAHFFDKKLTNDIIRKSSILERIFPEIAGKYIKTLPPKEQLKIYQGMQPHSQYKFFTEGFMSLEGQFDYLKRRNKIFEQARRASLKGDSAIKFLKNEANSATIQDESISLLKINIGEIIDGKNKLDLLKYMQEHIEEKNLPGWKGAIDKLFNVEGIKFLEKHSSFLKPESEYVKILGRVINNIFSLNKYDVADVFSVFNTLKSKQIKVKDKNENQKNEISIDNIEEIKIIEKESKKLIDTNELLLDFISLGMAVSKKAKNSTGTFKKLKFILLILLNNLEHENMDENSTSFKKSSKIITDIFQSEKDKLESFMEYIYRKSKKEKNANLTNILKFLPENLLDIHLKIAKRNRGATIDTNSKRNEEYKSRRKKSSIEKTVNGDEIKKFFSKNDDENEALDLDTKNSINKKEEKNSDSNFSFVSCMSSCFWRNEDEKSNEQIPLIQKVNNDNKVIKSIIKLN